LLVMVAVGGIALVSSLSGYEAHSRTLDAAYTKYETQFGVTFDINQEIYDAMTEAERENYKAAYDALVADREAMDAYNMVINLSILSTTFGILLAVLLLEFVVPLLLKNGQTLGKKCFALGVVRVDGVKLTPLQLFVRTVLGKYTVEIMLPVYLALMVFWGTAGSWVLWALLIFAVIQLVCVAVTQNRSAIHDLMAGTVVVDISSQKVFESTDDLLAYVKRVHAEQAQKQDY
ncbi:MAG: RDD family protein, partial [Oscillospiraceae bacterium]|nr:RDD family protein [Oscillospiraceae bacterium]